MPEPMNSLKIPSCKRSESVLTASRFQDARNLPFSVLLLVLAMLCTGCATQNKVIALTAPPQSIAAALKAADLPESALAVVVKRLDNQAVVWQMNAERASAPASTMKIPTTLAALETFDPTFRPSVQILSAAPRAGNTLAGDVTLRGLGFADFDFAGLTALLSKLAAQGITNIDGDVVVDRGLFSPARMDVGVTPFDESPEFRYNVIPDAMMVNANLLQFNLAADERALIVTMTPQLPNVAVDSQMTLDQFACADWDDRWQTPLVDTSNYDAKAKTGNVRITLRGVFPKNCTTSTAVSVLDRDLHLAQAFKLVWERQLGGTWTGTVRSSTAPAGEQKKFAEQLSRPMGELVRATNKPSDNALARTMYLQMGVGHTSGAEPTLIASERRMRAWMRGIGLDDSLIVLENGSGLSRTERIPAAQLAKLLEYAYKSPWSHEFIASLPLAGLDGTLRNRLTDSPAKGRARMKTGTLRDVVAVAGYVPDQKGNVYVVVGIVNHPRASHRVARPVVDALIDWVARLE
jgi:serine-type D-Ala-D-Ala carboxypeptidase/endopeptidase (penicillin-binding protein 4)